MRLTKLIQSLLLGLAIGFCLWLGMEQNPSMAATPTASTTIADPPGLSTPQEFAQLAAVVDQYLIAMPAGYYTIGNVEALKDLIASHQPLLVDVRSPSEYRSGHIPGAINIPLQTLARNLNQIPTDQPVVLYCSTGYRSAMGVMTLHLLNYDNIQGFPPSFMGWKAAGEAIIKS